MIQTFNKDNFHDLCNQVALRDFHLEAIIGRYGYPPFWSRKPTFETLLHIILEQQVSLASAKAALNKLKDNIGSLTPKKLLALSDDEMKACYFSRQKIAYSRHLAESILGVRGNGSSRLVIDGLQQLEDEEVRRQLKAIKGIGDWTADVYLMMVLQRCDLFPLGDIALVNSVRHEMKQPELTKNDIQLLSEGWKPYRTVAAFLFWHAYIQRKGIKV